MTITDPSRASTPAQGPSTTPLPTIPRSLELSDMLSHYLVMPKISRGPRPNMGAKQVTAEVQRRMPFKFNTNDHAAVARNLGVRPPKGEPDRTIDNKFCEYVPAAKIYVYNQKWIDRVVELVSTVDGFLEATGRQPTVKE